MSTATSKGFKIRKPSSRRMTPDDIADREEVMRLEDLRMADIENPVQSQIVSLPRKQYDGSEDEIVCSRFPHMKYCGCIQNCLFQTFQVYQITNQLYICGFVSGFKTRSLLQTKITHILNTTCKEYTKRTNFFNYNNIDVKNNTEEDIKKFFRITNRYIDESIKAGGTVLIHGNDLQLPVCFAVSYLIGVLRTPIKQSMEQIRRVMPNVEVTPHFFKQLQNYDLEKLAFVTIKRQQ